MSNKGKLRIYLRKIQPLREPFGGPETMVWIWMGLNPLGEDWSLGGVYLFSLEQAAQTYRKKLKRAGIIDGTEAACA